MNYLNQVFRFLKKPVPIFNPDSLSFQLKWKRTFYLFFINLLFGITISFLANLLISNMPFQSDLEVDLSQFSPLKLILFAGLLIPLLEEIIFRLPLIWSKINIRISLITALCIFGIGLISYHNSVLSTLYIVLFVSVVFSMWIPGVMSWLEQIWKQHFVWLFYSLTLLFALYHLSNYSPFSIKLLLVAPILISSQVISSLFLGYIRINFGFVWAIGYHIVWNSMLISVTLIGQTTL